VRISIPLAAFVQTFKGCDDEVGVDVPLLRTAGRASQPVSKRKSRQLRIHGKKPVFLVGMKISSLFLAYSLPQYYLLFV
jgi:hypothetical protein